MPLKWRMRAWSIAERLSKEDWLRFGDGDAQAHVRARRGGARGVERTAS